jgi:hypothetical protein
MNRFFFLEAEFLVFRLFKLGSGACISSGGNKFKVAGVCTKPSEVIGREGLAKWKANSVLTLNKSIERENLSIVCMGVKFSMNNFTPDFKNNEPILREVRF